MSATRDSRVEENLPEAAGSRAGESWFVSLLHALIRRRRSILYFVLASGVVSAVWSLITPSIYESQTKILLPQQTPSVTSLFASSSLAGLAASKDLSSALRNPTDVYVSMLASRSITDAIIDRFHLMDVYKTKLRTACRLKLNARVILTAEKGNIISIVVQDEDPKRAAEIANGFVEELSRFNQALNLSEAVERRKFFEGGGAAIIEPSELFR